MAYGIYLIKVTSHKTTKMMQVLINRQVDTRLTKTMSNFVQENKNGRVMSTKELINKIESLDEVSRKILEKQIEDLLNQIEKTKQNVKRGKAGFAKGFFESIPDAEEFNKPLEDFKDYM